MTLEVIYVTRHGVRCFPIFPISISHFPIFPHGQNAHPTKPAASHLVDQPCFYSEHRFRVGLAQARPSERTGVSRALLSCCPHLSLPVVVQY